MKKCLVAFLGILSVAYLSEGMAADAQTNSTDTTTTQPSTSPSNAQKRQDQREAQRKQAQGVRQDRVGEITQGTEAEAVDGNDAQRKQAQDVRQDRVDDVKQETKAEAVDEDTYVNRYSMEDSKKQSMEDKAEFNVDKSEAGPGPRMGR